MRYARPFVPLLFSTALLSCNADAPGWPPKTGDVHVLDLDAYAEGKLFFARTWVAIEQAAVTNGLIASTPLWSVDGSNPWRVTPEVRVHGQVEGSLMFDLAPTDKTRPSQFVILSLRRAGRDAPWTLLTYSGGFVQPPNDEGMHETIGNPEFEVALKQAFPTTAPDFDTELTPPPSSLVPDIIAVREFAAFLAPHDSAMRAIVKAEKLRTRDGSPYEWFGVAPVDSLDRRLGMREGVLRVYLTERKRDHPDWRWFELNFVRANQQATWQLLDILDEDRVRSERSEFHSQVRRIEDAIRRRFDPPISMSDWWSLRQTRRMVAPTLGTR